MSHYHTSCANITIGLLHSTIPELAPDLGSESGTPLVTPIHSTFGNISNSTDDTSGERIDCLRAQIIFNNYETNKGIPIGLDRLIFGEYNHLDKCPLVEGWRDCPPAPRIDNGSFESSFGLDISVDSSSEDNYSPAFSKLPTHLQPSLGCKDSKYTPEVRRADTLPTDEDALEACREIFTVPRTPRPDTGSRSSAENVALIWKWDSEKQDLWRLSQFHSVTPSVSVKRTLSRHAGSSNTKPAEQLTPDAPSRIIKWNLGLGLTLDDIAEPDGCGASIGELSMEFTEDSFFEVDTDSGYCSTADTTLNTTIETIPDLTIPCPNSPVGSASQALGPELGITPQIRILSLQGHQTNAKRQSGQCSSTSAPGTRPAYTTGFHSVARLVGRFGMNEHGEFCGLSNGATQEFAAGECSLIEEAQGRSGYQMADVPVFALLPPIEL